MQVVVRTLSYLRLGAQHQIVAEPHSFERFDAAAYSLLKYGDGGAAQRYGQALCRLLVRDDAISGPTLLVSGSAYHAVPTAVMPVAEALTSSLNAAGYAAALIRMRCDPYGRDYGAMDYTARARVLANNNLRVSHRTRERLPGSTVVTVDDVRITGMHEQAITGLLAGAAVDTALFCYIAILRQQDADAHPRTEDRLNHAYVQTMDHIIQIASGPDFYPNARTCKYILGAAPPDVVRFGQQVPYGVLQQIMRCMRADRYHVLPQYAASYRLLESIADRRMPIPGE